MADEDRYRVHGLLRALRAAEQRFWMERGDRVEHIIALVGRRLYANLLKGDPLGVLWRMDFETGQLIAAGLQAPVSVGFLFGRPLEEWEYRIVVGLYGTGVSEAEG